LSWSDATSSLSWYLYQADVALLETLNKIHSLKDSPDELSKWFIEVEGEEDFVLCKQEWWINIEKQLYQVKEYESWAPGKYHEAVVKLFKHHIENIDPINKKYYLCSKKKVGDGTLSAYLTKLKESDDKDVLFQKCLCWISASVANLQSAYDQYISNRNNKSYIKDNIGDSISADEIKSHFNTKIWNFGDGWFLDNFKFWKNDWYNEHTDIYWEIWRLLISLNPFINSEYHLKYLESKIKRYIQAKKNNISWVLLIGLQEIYNDVMKTTNSIIDLIVTDGWYDDIFYNHFKASFIKYSLESISSINLPFLAWKDEESILIFKENFLREISHNVFQNKEKLKDFIKHTSPHINSSYFSVTSSYEKKESLNNLLTNATEYIQMDLIKRKIALLIRLYYLSCSHVSAYSNNGYFNNDILWIRKNHKSAICIWTSEDSENFRDIISNNPEYLYEYDYLWIKNSSGRMGELMGKKQIEDWFDSQNTYEKNPVNIRKIWDVRTFCLWCHENFMDDECWLIKNCTKKTPDLY
jgi:hypothetical protein